MIISVYSTADGTPRLVTRLTYIIDYKYRRNYYSIGSFSMTLPDTEDTKLISKKNILHVMFDENNVDCDSLYVTSKVYQNGKWIISGFDLKYLLSMRITLFPMDCIEAGTYGYDVRTGYTGDIVSGYINYNLCSASDPNRRIPWSFCVTEQNIGIENDTCMSRLQPLSEVVEKLCSKAGIGYHAFYDITENRIGINIYAGKDLREKGIAFGTYVGNAENVKLTSECESEKTVVWAVNGTGADNSTVTAVELSAGSGIDRKETVATMNCPQEDVEIYARKAAEDAIPTKEYDVSAYGNDFPALYNVGDIVRIAENALPWDNNDARIVAIEKQFSGGKSRVRVILADYRQPQLPVRPINKLNAKNLTAQNDIIDQKLDSGGGSGSSIGKDLGEKNVSFNDLANNSVEREAHLNAIFGERNKVGNGVCNIVGGSHNYVNTSYSLAIGEFLNVSDEASQIVCGVYNAPQGGARFVVGNGSGEGSRSNAAWISSGGDMTLMGSLYAQDAVCEGLGTFRRGLNIPLGDGIRSVDVFEGEVLKSKLTLKLGDGMAFSPDPDFPDNSKLLTLNIGEGLEFTAEEAAEGESAPEESKKLSLKRATVSNIGGIQLGEGLSLNNVTGKTDIMQASSTRLGGIKLGEGLVRNTETGGTDIRRANGAQLGGIILGNGLALNNETGKTDLAKATGGQLGGIILGEGLELNSETGKVDVTGGGGLTVENAVIIQEANAHYILHNYTVVDYINGNKVCYAGPQNQIIVNGYVFNKNSAELSDIGRAMYPAARFDKAGTSTSNMISNVDFYFDIVSVIPEYATIWAKTAPEFYWYTSALNTFDLSRTGIAFTWDAFYPPCDGHPYGFVYGLPRICYVSDAEGTFVSTAMYGRCYFDFASEAEYNAAIRLTYEPNTLKQVVDNIT